jgi:hypothetical protein
VRRIKIKHIGAKFAKETEMQGAMEGGIFVLWFKLQVTPTAALVYNTVCVVL